MDPLSPGKDDIRQVGRRELYTDFGKRIEFLKAFLGFTEDDVIIFNRGAKYLKAALPDLTHRLYAKMLDFDITARALRTRTTTSEGEVEDLFTLDSPHVQRRKIFWKWYLTRLFSDPTPIEYWEYLAKVGEMHTGKVLMHPLKIEYMHMNTCLGTVNQLAIETISLQPDLSITFKFALIRTINKILCIQNDLISRCYIREGEEFDRPAKTEPDPNSMAKFGCPHAEMASTETAPSNESNDTGSIDARSMDAQSNDARSSDIRSNAETRSETRSNADTRSVADTVSTDARSIEARSIADARSVGERRRSVADRRSAADTRSIADIRSMVDARSIADTRSVADTTSTEDTRSIDRPGTAPSITDSRSLVERPSTGTASIPVPAIPDAFRPNPNPNPNPNPDSRPNTGRSIPERPDIRRAHSRENTGTGSSIDGASLTDARSNSDASSIHPRCLVPGMSQSQSRPTSAGRPPSSSSRDRSASIDLVRVISSADPTGMPDVPLAHGGHKISPSYAGTLGGFTSPFAAEQTFETKIWSAKSKQKWYKAAE
ncbi:hypothetical protein BO71DRAFT_401603 [Aspergillus ellipticus CBS 707.79]|uniref:Globin-sensor domain-containing protein n=1 Tax=Aspergillus ellipticus CBS 707.79 TaxID=1448320 RepID=A0A319DSU2_9EURO|nr:hypothetical protein BO71DRAFT_401603 [Aspergillus ellipticus CBS 707.79]